ncbi:MAG TPA: polysaccharide biosynthesis/export family protein [Nitrospiria bacterium]|nr:polysaccharide biosynthesis/export family protein [Nitrospiria bacterium]
MGSRFVGTGVIAMIALLSACASRPVTNPVRAAAPPAPPAPIAEYRIGPEDVLEIVVWKNADLSKTVTVRPDGIITLPLIGELRAGGLTASDVRAEIKSRLERYKEVPEVSVTVADIRSYNLYIVGEVRTPGRYAVKSYTTLLQALALAGGFTEWADSDEIVVVRRDAAAKEQRIRVRYKDLIRGGDFGLNPGDTVVVP